MDSESVSQPQQQRDGMLQWVLSSPHLATTLKWIVISGVTVVLCGAVVYYIHTNSTVFKNLKRTIQSLHSLINALNEKIDRQNVFIKAQQQLVLSLLQMVEKKFETQDKNTRELVQKSLEKVQTLTDQTVRSVERMSQKQVDGALEKRIGSAVLQMPGLLSSVPNFLQWPLSLVNLFRG